MMDALWRVVAVQHRQQVLPRESYRWDNRGRGPAGVVVLQLTLQGELLMRHGGVDISVPARHAALFAYDEDSHYFLPPAPRATYLCRWVTLAGAGLREHWDRLRELHGSRVACDPRSALRRRLDELTERRGVDGLEQASAVHALVMAVYAECRSDRIAGLGPAERAVERLRAQPCHPWSIKELAAQHGCSREHLVRVFRDRVGEAPGSWLARRRLDQALRLLRDTDLPIAQVAAQCGYGSAHTLARQVRQATGAGPSALRR